MNSNTALKASGWLLLGAILLTIDSQLRLNSTSAAAGVAIWIFFLLNLGELNQRQRVQNIAVMKPGIVLLGYSIWVSPNVNWLSPLLNANQLIITLLAAISFLQVTTKLTSDKGQKSGKSGFKRTFLSTHLISSVINVSAMVLVAERLKKDGKLTSIQGVTLARSFAICAFWSPFYAAMAVTLISAPGSELARFLPYTATAGIAALVITYIQLTRRPDISQFQGYPISVDSLKLPLGLAAAVLLLHYLLPQLSVIMLVSSLSILLVLTTLFVQHSVREASRRFSNHISHGLPNIRGEIALFISSTVLAAGTSAIQSALQLDLAPNNFDALAACVTLTLLVALSLVGIHPVTSNLIAGATLMPATEDPNLLAITLLMSWSMGSTASPLAGNQIILQGRYGVRARDLLRANIPYTLALLPVCYLILWFY